MFEYIVELIQIANNKDRQILELRGRLDCANGKPAVGNNKTYLDGYSQQYAEEKARTAEIMGAL